MEMFKESEGNFRWKGSPLEYVVMVTLADQPNRDIEELMDTWFEDPVLRETMIEYTDNVGDLEAQRGA